MGLAPPAGRALAFDSSATGGNGTRKRPFGVYVIVLLQALNAVTHGSGVIAGVEDPLASTITGVASDAFATVLMLVGLVVAAGLLLLKRWAWVATMLWVGAIMATELILFFRGDDPNYAVMVISIAQVFYLNLSDVQATFAARHSEKTSPR